MARLLFMGTGSALPSASQDNASLLLENNGSYLMIDCSGTPYRKLLKLGVDPDRLEHIVITHHHVDHIYGLPSLVECLWIKGRSNPLHIYALPSTMEVIITLLDLWKLRDRFIRQFPIHLHTLAGSEDELVLQHPDFTVRTTPTLHAVPSVATKVIFPGGTTFVYSSDTAPCQSLIDFAKGVDHFLMECTFCEADEELAEITYHIHSSEYAQMAGKIGAGNTILIHHSDDEVCPNNVLLDEIQAATRSARSIIIPRDLEILKLDKD